MQIVLRSDNGENGCWFMMISLETSIILDWQETNKLFLI